MDLSEEYINMCKVAKKELPQKLEYGDYVSVGEITDLVTYDSAVSPCGLFACGFFIVGNEKLFAKIFRQDQLQGLITGDFIETCDYISHFTEKFVELKTPEKILLKIVMAEKFNKVWNGSRWVDVAID